MRRMHGACAWPCECECGTSRTQPRVPTEPSVHARDAQAFTDACCGRAPPAHLLPAAALQREPYSHARETAEEFTRLLRKFASDVKQSVPAVDAWSSQNIVACVQNAITLMNSAAGANWGKLFELNVIYPDQLNSIVNVFKVQFSCNMVAEDDEFTPAINAVKDQESVVARLVLSITQHKAPTRQKVSVSMASGQTAVCVRCMHLATLLRACALLVAQQIAYLGNAADSVLFTGDPVSEGTQRIYGRLFAGLGNPQRPNGDDSCQKIAVQLRNPGTDAIPQSITNVTEQLWHWYDQSAFMCGGALPPQIQKYKAQACECGTRRKPSHAPAAHEEKQVHAADGQVCVSVCGGCAPPTLHFAAAALPLWTWYGHQAWIYTSAPLPAQIRHLSPSAAPASAGQRRPRATGPRRKCP